MTQPWDGHPEAAAPLILTLRLDAECDLHFRPHGTTSRRI
jgi:hypothetical protein